MENSFWKHGNGHIRLNEIYGEVVKVGWKTNVVLYMYVCKQRRQKDSLSGRGWGEGNCIECHNIFNFSTRQFGTTLISN